MSARSACPRLTIVRAATNYPMDAKVRGIALCIGNSYSESTNQLLGAPVEAKQVAAVFAKLGFESRLLINATAVSIDQAVSKLARDVKKEHSAVVFYFSGHGADSAF
jgi:uncharacterized caspase-like protein